ncbi:MAG: DEAD/DEAH box helicase, partial [Halobacteria archaeon]|nr:DEAD/DEAH box helicase [Halobacteria archaeon]
METRDLSLPDEILDYFVDEGIEELYPPQSKAVEAGVIEGENVVAAVPTASGKTLIAQLGMLSSISNSGGKALYVVPLRALASEKYDEFSRLPGVDVGISTGDYDSRDDYLGKNDIIVATSEKVDSLIRNGVSWIEDVSCVVVDEVHLLDSGDRGPTLEVTIAKLRRLTPSLQIIALSATVANPDEIAGWLDAELVETDWRPVELRKGILEDTTVEFDNGDIRDVGGDDVEALVCDTVDEGGQCLVFVNSRRNSQALARRLSRNNFAQLGELKREVGENADTEVGEELAECVASGVAFHHAGLKNAHRSLVEETYRDRRIKVICATPTLAAGVNVPARRVVVRDYQRYTDLGMEPIPVLEVHQMFGRAGRPGLDPYGEAILVAGEGDKDELWQKYILGEPEAVYSKLASRKALRTHILSTVASGFARSRDGVLDNDELEATDLGHQVSRLYIDPMTGAEIVDALRAAVDRPDGTVTALTFLETVCATPDIYPFYLRKGEDEEMLSFAMEHEDKFIDPPSEFDRGFEDWLASLKTARVIYDWINEADEDRIADEYGVGPGDINARVERADWLLYAAESLAELLDIPVVEEIHRTRERVSNGVKE